MSTISDEAKEKQNEQRRNRSRERKIALIHRMGGTCIKCGLKYDGRNGAAFSLHRIDEETKDEKVARMLTTRSWDSVTKEAEKCELLCALCHTVHHIGEY